MEKRSFRRGTMNENWQKEAFPHEGNSKISENRLSATGENKKSVKIGFPSRGKTRNRRKTAFPHGEKSKNGENRLSQHWENKKSAKNGFPNIGKNKKCHWLHFPTPGKTKNPESLLSDFRGSVHFDTSSYRHQPGNVQSCSKLSRTGMKGNPLS